MRPQTQPFGLGVSAIACVMTLGVLNGCDGQSFAPPLSILVSSSGPGTTTDPTQVQGTTTAEGALDESEFNDEFAQATGLSLDGGGVFQVQGSLASDADIDVYDLGTVTAGTRIIADVRAGTFQDLAAALFDENQNLIVHNDDRGFFAGELDPLLDVVVRHDSPRCYLVVTASPNNQGAGDYGVEISKLPDQEIPAPRPQTVLLDFDGAADVRISNLPGVTIPAFDAADIASSYSDQTGAIIGRIVSEVRNDFSGLDVTITTPSEGSSAGANLTRIFFGTFSPDLLGLADSVDGYNQRPVEEAIIYTDTFRLFMPLSPSADEMAMAIANVTSHEIGHLLGLNHTEDTDGVMDITASANRLMLDQSFLRSSLERHVFTTGYQDARLLLFDAVGGDAGFLTKPASRLAKNTSVRLRAAGDVPISKSQLARCFCENCRVTRTKQRMLGVQ